MKTAASIAILALATLTLPAALAAHPKLLGSAPAARSTVSAPKTITLNFNEKLMKQFTGLDLTMMSMPGMPDKPMKMSGFKTMVGSGGKTLTAQLPKPLTTGGYRVDWHAVGTDTHRMTGAFTFTVR